MPLSPSGPSGASPNAGLTKAELQVEGGTKIPCQFNPSTLSISKKNDWQPAKKKGGNAPTLNFVSGGSGSMTLELMLDVTDHTEPKSVTHYTDKLVKMMEIVGTGKGAKPPAVQFVWGSFHSFKAVVTSLDLKFTYFDSDGTPLRAQAKMTLQQMADDSLYERQNPTSGTPYPHRVHITMPGETLDRIAARYYDDPTLWRVLARANAVVDPLAITAGTPLVVPDVEEGPGA